MELSVDAIQQVDDEIVRALRRLIPQVSANAGAITRERVESVALGPESSIVVARLQGRVVGSATLLTVNTLVGTFGYVEEVAVDSEVRGQGIGRALINGVLDLARAQGHDFVELTSRSSRVAANRLYLSAGFAQRETNVYRYDLRPPS